MRGTMLWFNEVNDVGFISTEAGERLAVHGSAFQDGARPVGRCAGRSVAFEIAESNGERFATRVRLTGEESPRRARRRASR